jgi:hypothetical protein
MAGLACFSVFLTNFHLRFSILLVLQRENLDLFKINRTFPPEKLLIQCNDLPSSMKMYGKNLGKIGRRLCLP